MYYFHHVTNVGLTKKVCFCNDLPYTGPLGPFLLKKKTMWPHSRNGFAYQFRGRLYPCASSQTQVIAVVCLRSSPHMTNICKQKQVNKLLSQKSIIELCHTAIHERRTLDDCGNRNTTINTQQQPTIPCLKNVKVTQPCSQCKV